ncbi:MAG: type II toxin-antitoxin system VapC family toxin [Gemmatimonadota bacterium]
MILVDANLLIYAHDAGSPHHVPSRAWLDRQLTGPLRVGLPWLSLLAFLRIVSNRRAYSRAVSIERAWSQVESWLDAPPAWIPQPTEHHPAILGALLAEGSCEGNLVPDAHLAALAIEHGLTLCSADRGFARFSELRLENPLAHPGTVKSPGRKYRRSIPEKFPKPLRGSVTAS